MKSIAKEIAKPLSPVEIFEIAEKFCNVFTYPELNNFDNILDLFKIDNNQYLGDQSVIENCYPFDDNSVILLYLSKPNFGHWCILNKRLLDNGSLSFEFLDSYGDLPDDQLEYVDKEFRKQSKQLHFKLSQLLHKYIDENPDSEVHYNDKQLQVLDGKTATCGRYVALFFVNNDLPIEEFIDKLKNLSKKEKIPMDKLVTIMTLSNY